MAPTTKQHILVVDDDFEIRDTLCEVLAAEGYGVEGASNGEEALAKLRQGAPRPGLILLDLMMPVMNGWQFRAQQSQDPALAEIPVVVISATGRAAQQVAPLEEPIDFLKKPVDLDKLLALIAKRIAPASA